MLSAVHGVEAATFSIDALVSQSEVQTGDTVEVICQVYNPESKKIWYAWEVNLKVSVSKSHVRLTDLPKKFVPKNMI